MRTHFAPRRRKPGRKPGPVCVEPLETRDLLTTLSLNSAGPLSSVIVGSDGSFQVQLAGSSGGQVYPGTSTPGDAGLFLRQQDGTIDGFDLLGRSGQTESRTQQTRSQGLHVLSYGRTDPTGALQTTLIGDNQGDGNTLGNRFQTIEVVTYRPGDAWFRVDTTVVNLGSSTLKLDAFLAADLQLAGSDLGVGYRDLATGAVGGLSLSGRQRGFVQANPTGGPAASHFQAGPYQEIWQIIGAGAGVSLNDTVNLPVGGSPFNGDPATVDNGVGLQWQALPISPGAAARFSAFWAFGSTGPVKTEPAPTASTRNLAAAPGAAQTFTVAQFGLPAGTTNPQGYQALIVWGDGSLPQYGTIQPQGSSYIVTAKHTYSTVGQFPVSVSIVGPGGGATVVKTAATVATPTLTLTGTLAASSDHGSSASDGITNDTSPVFQGQGTAGGTVRLVAQSDAGQALSLGSTTVNAQGNWSLKTIGDLPDGSYTILATVQLGSSQKTATLMGADHPLVIDTQGPNISGFSANIRQGQITLTLTDTASGLDLSSATIGPTAKLLLVLGKTIRTPTLKTTLNQGATTAVANLTLQTRPKTPLGRLFALQFAGSLQDRAGNKLDGTFLGTFPTGPSQPGTPFQVVVRTDSAQVKSISTWDGNRKTLTG